MRFIQRLLLLVSGLCASLGIEAASPTATAVFNIEDPVTHEHKPALAARLDQYVCISIHAELVTVGEHSLQMTIYDGVGNEIHRSAHRKIESSPSLNHTSCYGFDEDHDAVGTWWYVAELDGQPLVSASIEIRPAR